MCFVTHMNNGTSMIHLRRGELVGKRPRRRERSVCRWRMASVDGLRSLSLAMIL